MNIFERLWKDDLTQLDYLLTDKERTNYQKNKYMYAFCGLALGIVICIMYGINYVSILALFIFTLVGWKVPYFLLTMRHKQRCNEVVDAIPLWVNMIYSLIGENNIYNSIVLSYDNAPECIKPDLKVFIEKIQKDNADKEAYMNFLAKYNIDGFKEIMMKLYEFRNLSKDKLKYEIATLNKSLSNLEKMKRERRFKNELFVADTITMVMIGVPCIYMFFVSLILSNLLL